MQSMIIDEYCKRIEENCEDRDIASGLKLGPVLKSLCGLSGDQDFVDVYNGKYDGKNLSFIDLTSEDKKNAEKDFVCAGIGNISGGVKTWDDNGVRKNPTCFWDYFKKEPVYPFLRLTPIGYAPVHDDMISICAMESVVEETYRNITTNHMSKSAYEMCEKKLRDGTLEKDICSEVIDLRKDKKMNLRMLNSRLNPRYSREGF